MTNSLSLLHPDDVLFFNEVVTAMRSVAKAYGLPLRNVTPLSMPEKDMADRLGDCSKDGDIRLVMRATVDGEFVAEPRSPELVWRTAAHELAHLRHFNHGHAFQAFQLELETALDNKQEDHREKVLRKLVKMQAQREDAARRAANGEATAEQEAEAFASMINRMLIENELNPSDIDYARTNDNDPVVEIKAELKNYGIKETRSRIAWQSSLARIVAKAHLCTYLVREGSNDIWFVGTKSHATVAEYVWGTLVPMAERMSEEARRAFRNECRKKYNYTKMDGFEEAYGYREAWINSFVTRIAERFEEAREAAVKEADARHKETGEQIPGKESVALIRLSGALAKVQTYMDDKFSSRRSAPALTGKYRNNAAGKAAGRAAANKMAIGRKGVAGGSGSKGLLK